MKREQRHLYLLPTPFLEDLSIETNVAVMPTINRSILKNGNWLIRAFFTVPSEIYFHPVTVIKLKSILLQSNRIVDLKQDTTELDFECTGKGENINDAIDDSNLVINVVLDELSLPHTSVQHQTIYDNANKLLTYVVGGIAETAIQ